MMLVVVVLAVVVVVVVVVMVVAVIVMVLAVLRMVQVSISAHAFCGDSRLTCLKHLLPLPTGLSASLPA